MRDARERPARGAKILLGHDHLCPFESQLVDDERRGHRFGEAEPHRQVLPQESS
jgi:hypothetical protein